MPKTLTVAEELLEKLEFLFKGYSNELRRNTQPYQFARVQSLVKDYQYKPEDALIRETLMEHIGSTPVVATAFYPYIDDPEVDLGKSLTMLAIHDIGELIAGDESEFTKGKITNETEVEAARKLLHPYYHDIYEDAERQLSKTAKFARSIDKMAPDIFDYLTPADITIRRLKHFAGVAPNEIMPLLIKHKRPYVLWNPFMTEFHDMLYEKLEKKLAASIASDYKA